MPRDAKQKIPYLRWGKSKILYLMYRSTGMEPDEIAPILPNPHKAEGEMGYHPQTIKDWRHDDPVFADAEQSILDDPQWFHHNIANPMKLAAIDARDVEYLMEIDGREYKGYSSKTRELLLTEMELINQPPDPGAGLMDFLAELQRSNLAPALAAPADELPTRPRTIKDVAPTTTIDQEIE